MSLYLLFKSPGNYVDLTPSPPPGMDRGVDASGYCDYSLGHVDKAKFDPRQTESSFLVQAGRPVGHHGAAGAAVGVVGAAGEPPAGGLAPGDVAHDPMTQLQACARSHHLHACVR